MTRGLVDLDCNAVRLQGEFIGTFTWIGTDFWSFFALFNFGLRGRKTTSGVVFPTIGNGTLARATVYQQSSLFHAWFRDLGCRRLE